MSTFFRLKPEHDGKAYPWPCEKEPERTIELFEDDILTRSLDVPGTFMKHTGLGCFGIEIPEDHLDEYEGWPRMTFDDGRPYGEPQPIRKIEGQS